MHGPESRRPSGRLSIAAAVTTLAVLLVIAAASVVGSGSGSIPLPTATERAVLSTVAEQLMNACLDKEEASAALTSALSEAGVPGGAFTLITDGPVAYRPEERDVVLAHLAAGCYYLAGSGTDAAGKRAYYVSGKESLEVR